MTSTTLPSAAPASYNAYYGFIAALAAAYSPPIFVAQAELVEYQPGSYIIVEGIFDDVYDIESTGYTFIESFSIEGNISTFSGQDGGTVPGTVMTQTYAIYTDIIMATAVTNRGGNGIPVLGITEYPWPYQLKVHKGNYTHSPGNIGGAQAGWQGTLSWSIDLKSLIAPA
jgi:hypothetical protein